MAAGDPDRADLTSGPQPPENCPIVCPQGPPGLNGTNVRDSKCYFALTNIKNVVCRDVMEPKVNVVLMDCQVFKVNVVYVV